MKDAIIITRHPALVEYIFEIGLASRGTAVIPHATAEQVRGRRCIGPLPLHLAALADSIVEIPLRTPPELRGVELTLEQVRELAGAPREYVVFDTRDVSPPDLDAAVTSRLDGLARRLGPRL